MHYKLKRIKSIFYSLLLAFSIFLTISIPHSTVAQEQVISNKQVKSNGVGKFILKYEPSKTFSGISQLLQERQTFDNLISELNNSGLVMRNDIPVSFEECGMENAFWSSQDQKITMCYELLNLSLANFDRIQQFSQEQVISKAINSMVFIFYHELGHGLVDVLPLNAVGQEEDTVDEFAVMMLYRSKDDDLAAEIVLDGSDFFQLLGGNTPAWAEHAPNNKRLFNLACLVFGSDPEQYAEVFINKVQAADPNRQPSEEELKGRAFKCRREFGEKTATWNRLLLPHYASENQGQGRASQPTNPVNTGNSPANSNSGVSERGTHW